MPRLILTALLALSPLATSAAVFQYAIPVATAREQSAAFLWIPPAAPQVRGVLLAGMTLAEREFVKDARIRHACAERQLAIVFLKCGLGAADIQKTLDDLAAASGYRELSVAPLFFVGHSAGGPQAKACAIRFADRCFGLVQYRGGVPNGAETVPPGIPALMMLGQFDEFGGAMRDEAGHEPAWERGRDALCAFRAADERNLGSVIVEPGAGHFAWSDRNAAYLALFIRKAAQARIPDSPVNAPGPVRCRPVDPRSGWLTDPAIRPPVAHAPAAYADYKGDRARANWHFDRELADATLAYHAPLGRKDQFIKWQDPAWIDAGVRYFFTNLAWVDDGQAFEVHPVYADACPQPQKNGGPRWPTAGQPVGKSSAPILVKAVGGPVIAVGPNRLRMRFDALAPAREGGRVTFMAYSAGDEDYRHTEQVGMMPRGFAGLKSGRDQSITFPAIAPLKPDASVPLAATSDSGLPVEYYVASGPAIIENGRLRPAEIPARARFPIEVKVVAWQFGRAIDPQVKTATPVEQTTRIVAP